eukprot:5251988-Prymnesium_polylepis.1
MQKQLPRPQPRPCGCAFSTPSPGAHRHAVHTTARPTAPDYLRLYTCNLVNCVKGRLGGWVAFRQLSASQKAATFAALAFRANVSPRAFATALADFREPSARFGSYLPFAPLALQKLRLGHLGTKA